MAILNKKAEELAEERLLDIIAPAPKKRTNPYNPLEAIFGQNQVEHKNYSEIDQAQQKAYEDKRLIMKEKLKRFELEDEYIEIDVEENNASMFDMFANIGMEEMGINIDEMFNSLMPKKTKTKGKGF